MAFGGVCVRWCGGGRVIQPSTNWRVPPDYTCNRHRPLGSRSILTWPTPLGPSRAAKLDPKARFVNNPETPNHRNAQTKTRNNAATPVSSHTRCAADTHSPLPPATTLAQSRAAGIEIDARFRVRRRDLADLLAPSDFSVSTPNREIPRKTARWISGLGLWGPTGVAEAQK
jgi:hypothetical protein